ncbi:MAG: hypothetical protein ABIT05_14890 [Chitinophagaceae bacterium]
MDKENQFELLQVMLKQIKKDDPGIKEFIEQQISNSDKKVKQKEISKEIIRRLRIQNKKLMEQVTLLRDQLKHNSSDKNQVMHKLKDLMKLNNSLAEALGSCNSCWGEDTECTVCLGHGSPGWKTINKRMFNLYILPSLERLYGANK